MNPDDSGIVRSAPSPEAVIARLQRDDPSFHSCGTQVWTALPSTLLVIARRVRPGDITIETGAGASTVVFAALGSHHVAISPMRDEHERIRAYCTELGVDSTQVRFIEAASESVLPTLELPGPVDFAFIDGKHSFPHTVIDFHYIERRLRVGGIILLDDIPIPAVHVLFRFLRGAPEWEFLEVVDSRAAAFHKLADTETDDNWQLQPFNRRYPDYSFAPWTRRVMLEFRNRGRSLRRSLGDRSPTLRAAWRRRRSLGRQTSDGR